MARYFFASSLVYLLLLRQKTSGQSLFNYDLPINYGLPRTLKNVGQLCATQMEAFLTGLANLDLWAITMIDASSKIPVGILRGNLYDYGNYDECVGIEHEIHNLTIIKGKFCWSALQIPLPTLAGRYVNQELPSNTKWTPNHIPIKLLRPLRNERASEIHLTLSLCIPDACNPMEVAQYLDLEEALFNDLFCVTNETKSLDASDVVVATILAVILFFMVMNTAYDVYLYKTGGAPAHQIFLAFSVFTNGRKLLAVNSDDKKQITSLYGIRCIGMLWVVLGHRFSVYASLPAVNMLDIFEWPSKLYTQYVQSAPIAVDTFFCLSGMMISYGYFSMKTKPKGISFIPKYYLHRYLRITPAVAALFLVVITIWRHLGSGMAWSQMAENRRDPCLTWWWTYFLYVQNYVNHDDFCIITTWYISADMQLFLISPFVLLPLEYVMKKKSKTVVYGACACLVLVFMVIEAVIKLTVESTNTYMTHERLSIWMVGLTTGIVLQEIKSKDSRIKINSTLNLAVWVGILAAMVSILLTMHDVRQNPTELKTNMYDTFHRPAWGLGLAWIVCSCTIGYGGLVNWFLSLPTFQVVSRLTYSMYLVHILVIFYSVGMMSMPWHFTEYNVLYIFCGDIICTTAVAFIWVLAFESPMITIEKCIFDRNKGSKKEDERDTENDRFPVLPATHDV